MGTQNAPRLITHDGLGAFCVSVESVLSRGLPMLSVVLFSVFSWRLACVFMEHL